MDYFHKCKILIRYYYFQRITVHLRLAHVFQINYHGHIIYGTQSLITLKLIVRNLI